MKGRPVERKLVWSGERDAYLIRKFPSATPMFFIVQELNETPGPYVKAEDIVQRATKVLGLLRVRDGINRHEPDINSGKHEAALRRCAITYVDDPAANNMETGA